MLRRAGLSLRALRTPRHAEGFTSNLRSSILPAFRPAVPASRRSITTVEHIPKRRRWPLYLFGAIVFGAFGYWKYLTHHNFPPTVADLLREGIWATINGAGHRKPDYRLALAKYIEALQEADRLEMKPWSDEYTGIQIVIADLYERLQLNDEAASMYAEVSHTYLMALNRGLIPPQDRDKVITRDLRVVLLAGLLMSTNPATFKQAVGLMSPHLIMATKEAAQHSPELRELLQEQPVFNTGYLRDMQTGQLPDTLTERAFGSYRNELVAMREMMTGIATASGEFMQALTIKLKTTQIMLTAGFSAGECLLSTANIASLMYLQAVNLRFTRQQRDDPMEAGAAAKAVADALAADAADEDAADLERTTRDMPLPRQYRARTPDLRPRRVVQPSAEVFLRMADDVYGEIIATVKTLDQRRTDFVPEAYVMALYGQGVIAVGEGRWDAAADRLGEARLRAKGSELEPLVASAEDEIAKVERLRRLSEAEIRALNPSELPSVDVMFWKLSPDTDDIERPELPDPPL